MKQTRGDFRYHFILNLILVVYAIFNTELSYGVDKIPYSKINNPYEILPWEVGQYALYQIISMEGEDANNRYKISLIGKEQIDNKTYFWIEVDIYGELTYCEHNRINKELKRNISFKALIPPKTSQVFSENPGHFISEGLFLEEALRLAVRIQDNDWHWIDRRDLFNSNGIISDTPYSISPHAKGRIDFSRLKIDLEPRIINVPAGEILSFHFFVETTPKDEFWDEGMDLWRSACVPILGLVKMEFSKTNYWEKRHYRMALSSNFLKKIYSKRVAGRMRPDTCTILLLDYGPR